MKQRSGIGSGVLRAFAAAVLGAVGMAGFAGCAATADTRPNVLVIITDDAGYMDYGFSAATVGGEPVVPTPNIDSIAEGGAALSAGYVTASVCGPSRAGLITGQYQQRFGYECNPSERAARLGWGVPADERTIGEMMRDAGYATAAIGKWHLGSGLEDCADGANRPVDQGFDEFHGLWGGSRSFFKLGDEASRGHALRDGNERIEEPDDLYVTTWTGEKAVEFISERAAAEEEKPWFAYVSYTSPHTPMHALDEDLEAVARLGLEGRRLAFAAMVRSLDRSVGEVLAAAEAAGDAQGRETLIFFVNDNGGATNNGSENGPYRGMKGAKFEGGIRVPYSVRWDGVIPAGIEYGEKVSTLDIAATSVAAGGGDLAAETVDGVDLVPFLTGEARGVPHETLFWRRSEAAAVREGDWKLVRSNGNPTLLFDLGRDPSERRDLSGDEPEVLAELTEKLEAWEAGMMGPRWLEGERWERNQRRKHRMEVMTREDERRFP